MIVTIVAAAALDGTIGKNNALPWPRLNADMKRFLHVTLGRPVIMGRKTFESLPAPLAGRINVVLTRNKSFSATGCRVLHSPEEVIDKFSDSEEIVIIGGAEIYTLFLPYADRIFLTYVYGLFSGDTRFPSYDKGIWFRAHMEMYGADERNPHPYAFLTLVRKPAL